MAGLLDPQITYNPTPLDQTTQGFINSAITRDTGPTSNFVNAQNTGVSEGAVSAQQSNQQAAQQNAGMGGVGQSAMNQAIRNQYNSKASGDINRMKNTYAQAAQMQQAAALQQAAGFAQAQQQVQTGSYERLMAAYNATETARAGVLSSILGGAGSLAGYAIGSQKKGGGGAAGGSGGMPSGVEGYQAENQGGYGNSNLA